MLKGVTIGDNCIIGYGSTVMKDIPANSVAVGTPTKVICTIEEYFKGCIYYLLIINILLLKR